MTTTRSLVPARGRRGRALIPVLLLALALAVVGCPNRAGSGSSGGGGGEGSEPIGGGDAEVITNRVDVPPVVRQNLGITFVEAERRVVADSIRMPGRFERMPAAYRTYHARIEGAVRVRVAYLQPVAPGDVLFALDSPTWDAARLAIREAGVKLDEARSHLAVATAQHAEAAATVDLPKQGLTAINARQEAHNEHVESLQKLLVVWQEREEELLRLIEGGAGLSAQLADVRAAIAGTRASLHDLDELNAELEGQRIAIRQSLAERRARLVTLAAEKDAAQRAVEAAAAREELAIASAASIIGVTPEYLTGTVSAPGGDVPRWTTLTRLEVHASRHAVVQNLVATDGAWVHEGDVVVRTVQPGRLLFRATALQADLTRLTGDMAGAIVPPSGGDLASVESVPVDVTFGLEADPTHRDVDLIAKPLPGEDGEPGRFPAWARHGVAAALEVMPDGNARHVIAVPNRAIVTDGLRKIIFRRAPEDPDKVIRMEAELGATDGRWTEVRTGLARGDEVVLHGAYELMLSSTATPTEGGHFHADGTWHAGAHEDE